MKDFNKKNVKKVFILIIPILLILLGVCIEKKNNLIAINLKKNQEELLYIEAKKYYQSLFIDNTNIPKEDISIKDIKKTREKINRINNSQKKQLLKSINELEKYIIVKNEIDILFNDNVLKSSVDNNNIESVKRNLNNISTKYQEILIPRINEATNQFNQIIEARDKINCLFIDNNKQNVRVDVSRNEYNEAKSLIDKLLQEDIKNEQNNYLIIVNKFIVAREKEEKRKREEEIRNAWVKLNIPYVSQNLPAVYNGCEAASLLMALKYKGYLLEMDLPTYATNMPKASDPHQGFVSDIFSLEPKNIVHWIAPDALARYGVSSSGNSNIYDISGFSLDDLDNELSNNNAVVIYLTGKLNPTKEFIGEIPKNLHVLLLSGYNKITGEQIITDPWTRDDGSYEWYVQKNKLEKLYNSVGKKAVVVR